MAFCIDKTDGYPNVNIINCDSSFADGLAFGALLHKYDNSLIDFESMSVVLLIHVLHSLIIE